MYLLFIMYSKVVCGPRKGAFANWETNQMYRLQKPTRSISQILKDRVCFLSIKKALNGTIYLGKAYY